jgi:periplasmic protein TonB
MMSAHIQQAGLLSGRSMTMMAVIGLHALVISALIAIKVVPELTRPGPLTLVLVPVVEPVDPVSAEPVSLSRDTKLTFDTKVVVPVPDNLQWEVADAVQPKSEVGASQEIEVARGSVVDAVTRSATELQYQIVRPTEDYYPAASLALEEQGIAVVRVCVDAAGRIDGVPTVQSSSGHRRLDVAAVRWARESLRFTPATLDGLAVVACKGFRVNFSMR